MMAINMGGGYDGNKHGGGGFMMAINMGRGYDGNKHGRGL